ncbi:MAG TPA: hypothetical protein VGE36_10885 [Roseateles sp.]
MKRISLALVLGCAALAAQAADKTAPAASAACEKSAADKKLHGAAAKSHIKKCMADASPAAPEAAASPACEKSAADKKLHGAAAKSHVKKCMADAASAPKS